MNETASAANDPLADAAPGKPALILAVAAPFATIALLATPLVFDVVRHAAGH